MTAEPLPAPPPPVNVLLRHEEVMAAAQASRSRGQGSALWTGWLLFAALAAAVWLGHLLSFWLVQQLPFAVMAALGPWLPVAIPALLALFAVAFVLRIEQWRAGRSYLRHLAAIGAPLEREGTYEVTAEALVLTTERITLAPKWDAIDTVEKGAKGWVLSGDQLHFLIPFAAFRDADAQRPLLAAITARLTPDARARSRDAVEFAAVRPDIAPGGDARTSPSDAQPHAELAGSDTGGKTTAALPLASGWLTQEQAGWAAGVMQARVAHIGFHRWAYPLTAAVTGMIVGMVIIGSAFLVIAPEMLMRNPAAVVIIGLTVPLLMGAWGLALGHRRLGLVLDKAWRGGLAARGCPQEVEARWSLADTGLRYESARFAGEAPYASLHQLLHEGPYWIAASDALTLCIPDAAFASPADAQLFMRSLLSRMTEPARERSVRLET